MPISCPVIVMFVPEPANCTSPGDRIIVHVPVEGKAVSVTLPVGISAVGCIIVPITGTPGAGGGAGIVTSPDNTEVHPASLVKEKLYNPASIPDIVVVVPVPVVLIVPG